MNTDKVFLNTLRWTLGITLVFWAGGVFQGYQLARELQVSWGSPRWMTALIVGGTGLMILIALLALTWTPERGRRDTSGRKSTSGWMVNGITQGGRLLVRLRPLHIPLMILIAGIFLLILLPPYAAPAGELLNSYYWRVFAFWSVTVAGAAILYTRIPERGWWFSVGASALVYGAVYRVAVFVPDISTYPFSLTWSEASRYYYASLFFSDNVYGVHANPTVLHPTRYWMQSIPFAIQGLPIWVHRLWQVVLWVVTNALAAGLVVRRIKTFKVSENLKVAPILVGLWAFLFLFQGPIWYHLVVMIIIVVWGTDTTPSAARFWKTLLVVMVASAWGGISRVNWIPFPAALAGMIYLLEREKGETPIWRYLLPPVVWCIVGSIMGLIAQVGYTQWSGNDMEQFASAFTSDLLWYRLFPSATYPLGVLPGIFLASLPVIWLGMRQLREQWGPARPGQAIHPIRWLGIGGVIGVFFAGGLVVSAKIGGGSNLHNMDGYLALLLVAGVYAIFGQVKLEPSTKTKASEVPPEDFGSRRASTPWMILAFTALIPILFALDVGRSYDYDLIPKPSDVRDALAYLNEVVHEATANGGEVLFISERQLLAFGELEVPLVADYEKVFLMEMAMSNNPSYLGQFEEDLRTHRFALVITVPLQANVQDETDFFGEENNAWVEHVNFPLACYYQQRERLKDVRVEILEPRDSVQCPVISDQ